MLSGFVGFPLVIVSQSGDLRALTTLGSGHLLLMLLGIMLAVLVALLGAVESAFNFRWCVDVSRELMGNSDVERSESDSRGVELFCVVVAFMVASAVAAPLHVVAGLLAGETVSWPSLLVAVSRRSAACSTHDSRVPWF